MLNQDTRASKYASKKLTVGGKKESATLSP